MKKGFTLLEIIIVIIIIGVLTSLALPRLLQVIQGAYKAEAFAGISSLRAAMERCYLMQNGSYQNCQLNNLDAENPEDSPNSHYYYTVGSLVSSQDYYVMALRNCRDGGHQLRDPSLGFTADLTNLNVVVYSTSEGGAAPGFCGGGLTPPVGCAWIDDWDGFGFNLILTHWLECP